MTRMGDTWWGEPWGRGAICQLGQKKKKEKKIYVRLLLSRHFLLSLAIYLEEIVTVNYQVTVPTKRGLFC